MAEFYSHMGKEKAWVDHVKTKLRNIEFQQKELNEQKDHYEWMLEMLQPCPECEGSGEWREIISQDESKYHKCKKCGGSGISKK